MRNPKDFGVAASCLVLTTAIFALDLSTPPGVADGMLYALVVLLASRTSDLRAPLIAATACTGLIIIAVIPFFTAGQSAFSWYVGANRALSIMTVWVTMMLSSRSQRLTSALETAESRYRNVVEDQTEMIARWRPDGTLTFVNNAVCQFLGQPHEELVGKVFTPMVAEEDLPSMMASIQALTPARPMSTNENRVRVSTGELHWHQWVNRGFFDADGHLSEVQSVGRDITEQKQAQADLRESEARFKQLAVNISEVFWLMTADLAHVLYVSPAYERIWGYPVQALYDNANHWHNVIHPEERHRVFEAFRDKVLQGTFDEVYRIVRSDGSTRWIHDRGFVVRDANNQPFRIAGIAQDITSQKEAERNLLSTQKHLQDIIDSLFGFVGIYSLDGILLEANQAPLDAAGLTREDVIGKPFWETYWWSYSPVVQDQLRDALRRAARGEYVRYDVSVRVKDGQFITIDVAFGPLRDSNGLVTQIVGFAVDITDRKRAEATLRRSESGFAEAQRIAHIGSWELDVVENRLHWSDEIYRIFEVNKGEFGASYESFLGLVHPEDRTLVDRTYTEALEKRIPYEIVHRLLMPDGRIKHVLERCETSYDVNGAPIRSVGTTQDITDRMVAKEKLRRSEERYRTLYDDNPSMYFTVAPEGTVLSVNTFGAEQLGYSPKELVGQSVFRIVHQDDRARVREYLSVCANNPGQVWNWEFRKIRQDGSVLWVRETARSGWDPDGRLVLFIVCEDISVRKKVEEALSIAHAELEERVRLRTSELSETNGRLEAEIREHTEAKETLQRREAILQAVSFAAKHFLLAVSWDGRLIDVLHRLGEAAAADHACVFRNSRTKDGDLQMSLQAEWVAEGVPSRLEDTRLRDVSYHARGLKRWEEDLSRGIPIIGAVADMSEAERSMMNVRGQRSIALVPIFVGQEWWGMMVFGLIRDERSWQSAEIEALQVAASTLGAGIQRRYMEAQIRLYAEELEQLVTQRTERIKELEAQRAQAEKLAALGQLAAGVAHEINNPIAGIKNAFLVLKDGIPRKHPYYHFVGMIEREIERVASIVRRMYDLYRNESQQEQIIALDTLMSDISYLLKPKLTQRKVILHSHIAPAIPPFRLVQRDLLQVMLNLVQNAVEASPEDGVVVVDVTHDRDHVRITVSDQGCGIPADELPHIFEPFFSGQHKRKQGGIGIGLSVSYSLVQAMGGRIEVVSQPDKGTTFTVVLPLAPVSYMAAHSEGEMQ